MEKINVKWGVNVESGNENFTLEELDVKNMKEWELLSEDDKKEKLQTALDELPERTCIILETWNN